MNNTSLLLDRSQVVSGDRILTGDSIAYNRELGFGEAFGNMSLARHGAACHAGRPIWLYNEKTEYAFRYG